MIETRLWKKNRGLHIVTELCRLCNKYQESVDHLLAGCEKLAGREYLNRHNNALMVLAVEWAKERGLLDKEAKWYQMTWEKGKTLATRDYKLLWDFEFRLRKTTPARRPDLILEDNIKKEIFIIDMTCPMEQNIETKRQEKLTKYRQLSYETREKRPGYFVKIIPIVIGCLGGGGSKALTSLKLLMPEKADMLLAEMTKIVLWEGESMIRKIFSGIIET